MSHRRAAACLGIIMALGAGSRMAPQSAASIQAASPPATLTDRRIRGADLRADVAILRRAYETLHPGLYRYNTPAQIDAAFRALEVQLQQDRTVAETYLALSVLAAKVKCGHTYANFFNQSSAIQAALFQGPRIPFYFRWLGDRMIVAQSFASDPRIRAGTEVLTLNGVPVAEILARLMTVARADGNNDAKRVAYLQVDGTSRYEAFDIYWPLFFPSTSRVVTLRVRDSEASGIQTLQVPPVTYADRLAAVAASKGSGATNSSATFEFAQTVRQNHLGTLVGQPTGGNQRGINGGSFVFLRLPNSGLELDLPLIGQFPDGDRPDAGLQPDILVVPTVKDVASGRDPELEAVRARLRRPEQP